MLLLSVWVRVAYVSCNTHCEGFQLHSWSQWDYEPTRRKKLHTLLNSWSERAPDTPPFRTVTLMVRLCGFRETKNSPILDPTAICTLCRSCTWCLKPVSLEVLFFKSLTTYSRPYASRFLALPKFLFDNCSPHWLFYIHLYFIKPLLYVRILNTTSTLLTKFLGVQYSINYG